MPHCGTRVAPCSAAALAHVYTVYEGMLHRVYQCFYCIESVVSRIRPLYKCTSRAAEVSELEAF